MGTAQWVPDNMGQYAMGAYKVIEQHPCKFNPVHRLDKQLHLNLTYNSIIVGKCGARKSEIK